MAPEKSSEEQQSYSHLPTSADSAYYSLSIATLDESDRFTEHEVVAFDEAADPDEDPDEDSDEAADSDKDFEHRPWDRNASTAYSKPQAIEKSLSESAPESARRFYCNLCPRSNHAGCVEYNDLLIHKRRVHRMFSIGDRIWQCTFAGCVQANKIWLLEDEFRSHLKRTHSIGNRAHLDAWIDRCRGVYNSRIHGSLEFAKAEKSRLSRPDTASDRSVNIDSSASVGRHGSKDNNHNELSEKKVDRGQLVGAVISQSVAPPNAEYVSSHVSRNPHQKSRIGVSLPSRGKETHMKHSMLSAESIRQNNLVQAFADQLFKDLGLPRLNKSEAARILTDLGVLLVDFALRLGQRQSRLYLRDAMTFIYENKSQLCESLSLLMLKNTEEENLPVEQEGGVETMMEDKIQTWLHDLKLKSTSPPLEDELEVGTTEGEKRASTSKDRAFDAYVESVTSHPSYNWLLGKLRSKLMLINTGETILDNIQRKFQYELPQSMPRRSGGAYIFHAVLESSWPSENYVSEQFPTAEDLSIGEIVTITGRFPDVQALTCQQYLEQTWPTTGVHLMNLLQQVMRSTATVEHHCERPDGAVLKAWRVRDQSLMVSIIGTSGVILEVAEQFSWLSAALGTFPSPTNGKDLTIKNFVVCIPSVAFEMSSFSSGFHGDGGTAKEQAQTRISADQARKFDRTSKRDESADPEKIYYFKIVKTYAKGTYDGLQGSCWSGMIGKLATVYGFPIRYRSQSKLGMEIPLAIAAKLVGTKHINDWGGNLFVKGCSAMLVPTSRVDNIVVWHLQTDSLLGHHVAYSDFTPKVSLGISMGDVSRLRHIVGWCPRASNFAGAIDAHYAVRHANLPRGVAGGVLAGNDLSFGRVLASEAPFVIPGQYQYTHFQPEGYSAMFRYLSKRFVLFWDKKDERGWLVNGVSALLHLVRASLYLESKGSASSIFVLRSSDLIEPRDMHAPGAAYEFFAELKNANAKVSVKKVAVEDQLSKQDQCPHEYEVLNDRVEKYFQILEKALTYSEKFQDMASSVTLNTGKRKARLEGWDFFHLATQADRVRACSITLPGVSQSWLELVYATGTAALFGQGFGELIKPSDATCCDEWKTLPVGKHYLAINTADLATMIEYHGDRYSHPICLSGELEWHNPLTAFSGCGCSATEEIRTGLIQQPCSAKRSCQCKLQDKSSFDLDQFERGAVVFGYNPAYGPPPVEAREDDFEDSGVGSSLSETRSQGTETSTRPGSSLPQISRLNSSRSYGDGTVSGSGYGHFGDNIVHNPTYNVYTAPMHTLQYSQTSTLHPNYLERRTSGIAGSKRSHSDLEVSDTQQCDLTTILHEAGPSKRARTPASYRSELSDNDPG